MPVEIILENKVSRDTEMQNSNEESVGLRTLRLTFNLLTNILIAVIVFICLLFAWPSKEFNTFQLHIVFCVLGYQLFMSHGILVLSKYNSWSMYLPRRYRKHLHWILQVTAVILVTVGTICMMIEKHVNFETSHGILGTCALITSLIGLFNGLLALHAHKFTSYVDAFWIKQIHYITGIGTILLSAACLCLGFNGRSFKSWSGEENTIVLIVLTCFFTVFVVMEFCILTGRRIRNLL